MFRARNGEVNDVKFMAETPDGVYLIMPQPNHSVYADTNPKSLKELLSQIDKGEAALPEFQRNFVWKPSAIEELIESVANNFPAGSLLRLQNEATPMFACRAFEGAPGLGTSTPKYLVLDGQQRLTSLYRACYGKSEFRFFIRLQPLIDRKNFESEEDVLFYERAESRRAKELAKPEVQERELIFPLEVLFGGMGFIGWMVTVAAKPNSPAAAQRQTDLLQVHADWIKTIEDYQFPVVTLSESNTVEAVCTIFETLNRTGEKLTVFDLLTARFWPVGVRLRDLRDKAVKDYPRLEEFAVDPYYLLQVVSLLSRQAPSCKRGDVLRLSHDDITDYWDDACAAMDAALNLVRDDCGVLTLKWLPYTTMLVPFAAALARTKATTGPQLLNRAQKIKRWFWCSVFNQSYEKAPVSQSAKDFNELVKWIEGGSEPESVRNFNWKQGDLRQITPRQIGLYRGVMALILSQGTRDFYSGSTLTSTLINTGKVDDHHIFPRAFLEQNNLATKEETDCVLNRTLIDTKTNQQISDKAPSIYMSQIMQSANGGEAAILDSHQIPSGSTSPLLTDDFPAFTMWREGKLEALIAQVTS